MSLNKNHKIYITLILGFIFLYVIPLSFKPLVSPDETRYAEISREMIDTGNWVVPHLGGIRYFEKPVLGYWMNSISMIVFGNNSFGIRFASVFSTAMIALMLFLLIRKRKNIEDAFYTVIIFLTSILVYAIGTFAVLDAHTSMFLTASLLSFFLAYESKKLKIKILWLSIFGIFCGLTFLTKGFLGFVIPGLTILPFLVWNRKWKEMLWMPWIPLFFMILISAPWVLMIYSQEPDFWHYFIVVEHWERFFSNNLSQHTEPFWYYIPVVFLGLIPTSFILPSIIRKHKLKLPQDDFVKYCLCWVIFPFIFFSISSGKIATYILPLYPAIAYLAYLGIKQYFIEGNIKRFDLTCKILYIIIGSLTGLFILSQILSETHVTSYIISLFTNRTPTQTAIYQPAERLKWILGASVFGFWAFCLYKATCEKNIQQKIKYFIIGYLSVIFCVNFLILQTSIHKKSPEKFFETYADHIPTNPIIIAYPNIFTDVSWYYNSTNVFVFEKFGELKYGLGKGDTKYPDTADRYISKEQLAEMVVDENIKGRIVFIMRSDEYMEYIKDLPVQPSFLVHDMNKDQIIFATYQ
ncbi:MAG: phospholipid carrier-dependent glycosyltransferase [Kiritimatiellae bacterium]|jgi:4-amino-4-deoxy-L-arabinose transferase|nr:phospholipid carrier-dependent glycosyltransferase [Kiritimatiellia bacterium]